VAATHCRLLGLGSIEGHRPGVPLQERDKRCDLIVQIEVIELDVHRCGIGLDLDLILDEIARQISIRSPGRERRACDPSLDQAALAEHTIELFALLDVEGLGRELAPAHETREASTLAKPDAV